MKNCFLLLLPLVALFPISCTKAPSEPAVAVHGVSCGCVIEDVGHCGEYVEIDGQFYELIGDLGLEGSMPFCKKEGLTAEVSGAIEGEKFQVASFKLVDV